MGKTEAGNLAARTAAVAFVVLATMAGSAAAAADTVKPGASPAGTSSQVATFTGEYVNGAPVYRLPTVTVSTSRAAASGRDRRASGWPRRRSARPPQARSTPPPRRHQARRRCARDRGP